MYLVTGGAGFIGSNLVAALEARGAEVVVCDRLRQGDKWRNLAKRRLAGWVAPTEVDAYLAGQRNSVSAIIHMGAISSTTACDGDLVLETNFRLSCRLFEAAAQRDIPFIYASSAATYGDGAQGFVDDEAGLQELRPLNLYGWSKHLFDRWVLTEAAKPRRLPRQWAGLKFFNVYGPNEYHKVDMQSVVAKIHRAALHGEVARLFRSCRPDVPDGGQQRDFVHVDDCVDIVCWLLQNPAVNGLFNAGTGNARSFLDLATHTQLVTGLEPRIEFVEMPESMREKYQYFTQADMSRLRAAGYRKPPRALEDGIGDYVGRFLSRPDPYR
jgi:ADP-L-glycero-D-manno-heptose 6-epimerase